jgi:hypothetical protein
VLFGNHLLTGEEIKTVVVYTFALRERAGVRVRGTLNKK